MRRISNLGSGLHHLDAMRKQNLMWATMVGVKEYTSKMMDLGISDRQWKVASDGIDMPIEYSTVRGIIERDEQQSEKDVEEIEDDMESRRMECERFQHDFENYRRLNREAVQEEPEEAPELSIYREIEGPVEETVDDVPEESEHDLDMHPLWSILADAIRPWTVEDMDLLIALLKEVLGHE